MTFVARFGFLTGPNVVLRAWHDCNSWKKTVCSLQEAFETTGKSQIRTHKAGFHFGPQAGMLSVTPQDSAGRQELFVVSFFPGRTRRAGNVFWNG